MINQSSLSRPSYCAKGTCTKQRVSRATGHAISRLRQTNFRVPGWSTLFLNIIVGHHPRFLFFFPCFGFLSHGPLSWHPPFFSNYRQRQPILRTRTPDLFSKCDIGFCCELGANFDNTTCFHRLPFDTTSLSASVHVAAWFFQTHWTIIGTSGILEAIGRRLHAIIPFLLLCIYPSSGPWRLP